MTALCEDRAGRLWVATDTDLQTIEHGRITSVKAQYTLGQSRTNVIYQDQMGTMWFGADNGLFRYHDGQAKHLTSRDGLPGEVVRVIIEAAAGGLWVGFYGGLMRWRDGKITTWTEQEGLPGNALRALYEDGTARSGSELTTAAWAGSRTANSPTTRSGTGCSTTASFKSWRTGAAICG